MHLSLLFPSGVGYVHHLQMSENPWGSWWHRVGAVYPGVIKCTYVHEQQYTVITACQVAAITLSSREWLGDIFIVSIVTGSTVAPQTAPSSWVSFASLFLCLKHKLEQFESCMFHFLSVMCVACIGVGHSDPAESQYYPCPWQPSLHTGLIPQHVVQRLPKGH